MQELEIRLNERSYAIKIAPGLLADTGAMLKKVSRDNKVMLVSNAAVFALYGEKVAGSLRRAGFNVHFALMPDGEVYKNMDEALKILDKGLAFGLERSSTVVALGGGVVGDLSGFIAAIYQRGINFVQIPTTLLAQVDSSVGGKVAVNHPQVKNLIGAFHQPRLVIIDLETLTTLDDREYRSGLTEVFKYGLIYDKAFFEYIEDNVNEINERVFAALAHIIYNSCRIKGAIVAEDEREEGLRVVLNLGHTFGHAVEQLTSYSVYRHGEAVAMGTMAAVHLAVDKGLMEADEAERVRDLYERAHLPTIFPRLDPEMVYSAMLRDKKVLNGRLRFVLPRGIGGFVITDDCSPEEIIGAIESGQA